MVKKIKNIFDGKKIDLARYFMSSHEVKILLTVALAEQKRKERLILRRNKNEQK